MTKAVYHVSVLVDSSDNDFAVYKKMTFSTKKGAVDFAKEYVTGTDGSLVVQIVGKNDRNEWIYTASYTAENHLPKKL